MGNYIFGLPGDTQESMQKTLQLSKDLCTMGWNAYAAMPLPGSQLYRDALDKGYSLPETYEDYSFFGYNTLPSPTDKCTAGEILKFRDEAYNDYHTYGPFLELVKSKYGQKQVDNILQMTEVKLKRKLYE